MLVYVVPVLAFLVVLLTSLFKHVNWSTQVKNLVAVVLSTVAAGFTILFGKDVDLSPENLFELALGIYGLSQLIYNFLMSGNAPLSDFEERLADTEVL